MRFKEWFKLKEYAPPVRNPFSARSRYTQLRDPYARDTLKGQLAKRLGFGAAGGIGAALADTMRQTGLEPSQAITPSPFGFPTADGSMNIRVPKVDADESAMEIRKRMAPVIANQKEIKQMAIKQGIDPKLISQYIQFIKIEDHGDDVVIHFKIPDELILRDKANVADVKQQQQAVRQYKQQTGTKIPRQPTGRRQG